MNIKKSLSMILAVLTLSSAVCLFSGCETGSGESVTTEAEKKTAEADATIYYDDEELQITDGTTRLKSGDTVAAGKSVIVTFDNTDNASRTVTVYLNGEELFSVAPNDMDAVILSAEAGGRYGFTTEIKDVQEVGAILTFGEGITVKDPKKKTVKASGTTVEPGEYTAEFSGDRNGKYLLVNGSVRACAVNGTSSYSFTVSEKAVSLSLVDGAALPLTNTMPEKFVTDLKYASDPSVMYDNGKYYMVLGCNWGENKMSIWQIREADDITAFTHANSKAYTAMTLPDFAKVVGTAYDVNGNWAPELQKIGDYYYIVTTYVCTNHGADNNLSSADRPDGYKTTSHRTIAILRSKSITEGWEVWLDHLNTPMSTNGKTWDVIDAVIYMEDGDPYLVASHEWPSQPQGYGGSYFCVKMKKDLSDVATGAEWHEMFRVPAVNTDGGNLSDAPCLYRSTKGELFMLYSTTTNGGYSNGGGYTVAVAKSSNGKLNGTWSAAGYLYNRTIPGLSIDGITGGHPGLVTTAEGQMYLTLHLYHHEYSNNGKNDGEPKRPAFIAVRENPETGLLEWGRNSDFVELDANGSVSQSLVKGVNSDDFAVSLTVRKARLSGTYVGFSFTLGDGSETKILLDPANGTYATQGKRKDTLSKKQSVVLDDSDFVTLSVKTAEDGVTVWINEVYNEELTQDLRFNMEKGTAVKEWKICAQEGSRRQTVRVLDWSFTV